MSQFFAGRRPSPALIVACAALVVALAGTAVAAPDLATKALTKSKVKQIANKQIQKAAPNLSVKSADSAKPTGPAGGDLTGNYPNPTVAPDAIDSTKIADGAVGTNDLLDGSVTTPKIADNAVTSAKIGADQVKASELGTTSQAVGVNVNINANSSATATVLCPAGTQVLSGGGGASSALVAGVESFQAGNGWLWFAHNFDGSAHTIFATAVCLNA